MFYEEASKIEKNNDLVTKVKIAKLLNLVALAEENAAEADRVEKLKEKEMYYYPIEYNRDVFFTVAEALEYGVFDTKVDGNYVFPEKDLEGNPLDTTAPWFGYKGFIRSAPGTLEKTLLLLSITRIILPRVLLPATTALGTINPLGREMGVEHGANVVMPNLSPTEVRSKYLLYDNKICTGDEAAECKDCMSARMKKIGYELVIDRGDFKKD